VTRTRQVRPGLPERRGGDGADAERALLRSALARIHSPSALAHHPFSQRLRPPAAPRFPKSGNELARTLIAAIEGIRPADTSPGRARAWRRYRLLVARYLQGQEIAAVCAGLGVSSAEYYRLLNQALDEVVGVLASSNLGGPTVGPAGSGAPGGPLLLAPLTFSRPLARFVGREQEIQSLARSLEAHRLVTIVGAPGVGKTRLALATAAQVEPRFSDGATFVPLASVTDSNGMLLAIADQAGPLTTPGRPSQPNPFSALRARRLLLILDNVEQIAGAASVVSALLDACPRLTVLATSRKALHAYGEQLFALGPLPIPAATDADNLSTLERNEAVEMFVDRARLSRFDFRITPDQAGAVVSLLRRLDGLPLAIELAAAKVRFLQPSAILRQLAETSPLDLLADGPEDRSQRQRTLRQAIDWSYRLLGEKQRALLRRVAVFAGGFEAAAVGAVEALVARAGDTTGVVTIASGSDVLERLLGLAGASLLFCDPSTAEPRFSMLDLIQRFAAEQLARSGEAAALRRAHAAYFTGLVESATRELIGPEQALWLRRLQTDLENVRAAFSWCLENDAFTGACQIATGLHWFFYVRGRWSEARSMLERALARTDGVPGVVRAEAMVRLGHILWRLAEYDRAGMVLGEARELGEAHDWDDIVAFATAIVGAIAGSNGDYARALAYTATALRRLGDSPSTRVGVWARATILHGSGENAFFVGHFADAQLALQAALDLYRQLGDAHGTTGVLRDLARLALHQGDLAGAITRCEEGLALAARNEDQRNPTHFLHFLGIAARRQGDLADSLRLERESLGRGWRAGDTEAVANCLEGLAATLAELGSPGPAVQCFGAASALRELVGYPVRPVQQADLAATETRLRASPLDWEAALATAREAPLEQTIALALSEGAEWPRPIPQQWPRR
jgi:predicted ATPase